MKTGAIALPIAPAKIELLATPTDRQKRCTGQQ
jgi:hypothetical protein